MSQPKFDRGAFLAGLKGAKEFKSLPPGFYNCTLEKCFIGVSQSSGRTQAVFGWRVDGDDEQHGGASHYVYQGLVSASGEPDEVGNKVFAITLGKLGLPGEYLEQNVDNLDAILEMLIGTQARLKLTQGEKNPDFVNTRVEKLLSSPLDNGPPQAPQIKPETAKVPAEQQTLKEPTDDIPQQQPLNLAVNDVIVVTSKEGQKLGKVIGYLEATNQVIVKYLNDGEAGVPDMVDGAQCQKLDKGAAAKATAASPVATPAITTPIKPAVIEEIAEVAEVEEIELKVGMPVSGIFGGKQKITGKIHKLDEAAGKVFINMGGKAYPCPVDTIEMVNDL